MAWTRELKTVWQIRFSDSGRDPEEAAVSVPKSEYPTKTAADKEAARLQVLYDQGEFDPWVEDRPGQAPSSELTLLEAVRSYVGAKRAAGQRGERGGWSDSTRQRYKATLEKFARDVGPGLLVTRLRTGHIRDWTTRSDLSEASQRTYHGMLRAFVKWLRGKDIADLEMPPPLRHRQTVPTFATVGELRAVCKTWPALAVHKAARSSAKQEPTMWYVDAWRFAFWQALRKSEITELRVGAIDLEQGRMRVGDKAFVPKGKDEKTIPLAGPARPIAERWMDGAGPGDRLFRRKTPQYMAKAFTATRKHSDVDKPITLHSLRHGRTVHLLEQGMRVHEVQRYLRHNSLDATMRYVQIVDQSLQDEIDGLDETGIEI